MKKKSKKENVMNRIWNSLWFVKIYKNLTRDKTKCPICQKNQRDNENPESMCFDCLYKKLKKSSKRL